ncbi:protein-disulfide reductase DsbD family protein [Sphingomonas jeddahensis]|uniref:Thiol:disulfide interchange protein DsbD n=1 Tax=Sphingomonas jeddahensis TaxID=1915074 RepID=A0A1V2EYX5_9SPHN|nr:Thiol:disulfide interchange protein DsbD precursor [Sphingomonas jeddahensis]
MTARQAWLSAFFFAVMTLFGPFATAQSSAAQAPHVAITLVPETARPAAGSTVTLAFDSRPEPEWHGYWQNPGDAGIETRLKWALPDGVAAGSLRYPVPERLIVGGLMNYVYEAPFAQLVDLQIPTGVAPGTRLPVSVKADYLVCTKEICVPETQTLSTVLTVGDGAIDAATRARFDGWRQKLPRPLGSPATWQARDGAFRLAIPFPGSAPAGDLYFYPLAGGAIDYAAPQTVARDGDRIVLSTKAAATPASGQIEGVLATGAGQGFAITAAPGSVAAIVPAETGVTASAALLAFAGALIGGLLLNIMPCVFPILSLKALSLAKSGETEGAARREALAYTAGVVLVCLALGGTLLALRAGGASVGWAFQLQDPRVIGVLLLLTMGIAFNLTGLFELPTPRFAGRSGAGGAFMTGALAAFVATPCTGPFMGAALGAALVLPPLIAMLVFVGLGLGIALPFLAIGFVPALRRRLPKPGAWMGRLRRTLSVPMFVTALALAWVLGRQAGVNGMSIGLAAALLAGVGLWWTGRRQHGGGERAWWPAVPAIALALLAVALVKPQAIAAAGAEGIAGAEPFSEQRLAALRAEGRPVFAYFTADWCLTCKVNERAVLDTDATRQTFANRNAAVLVGDWTDGDPALGRFIEAHNRAGVPLYLWYAKGAAQAQVLPQMLTTRMLKELPGGETR